MEGTAEPSGDTVETPPAPEVPPDFWRWRPTAVLLGAAFCCRLILDFPFEDGGSVVLLLAKGWFITAIMLLLAAVFQFSDGVQVAANGALRGLKDTTVPMAITALAYWGIGMPVGWWLAFRGGFGARGMWMGLIAGLTVAAVLLYLRFARMAAPSRP